MRAGQDRDSGVVCSGGPLLTHICVRMYVRPPPLYKGGTADRATYEGESKKNEKGTWARKGRIGNGGRSFERRGDTGAQSLFKCRWQWPAAKTLILAPAREVAAQAIRSLLRALQKPRAPPRLSAPDARAIR